MLHPCESMAFLRARDFQRRLKQEKAWEKGLLEMGKTVSFQVSKDTAVQLKALSSGGLAAPTATVSPTATVERYGMVLDHAKALDYARVGSQGILANEAVVSEYAQVNGIVCQKAKVKGHAIIGFKTIVHDEAEVSGDADLSGGNFRIGRKVKINESWKK